jgi:hypothetical protein
MKLSQKVLPNRWAVPQTRFEFSIVEIDLDLDNVYYHRESPFNQPRRWLDGFVDIYNTIDSWYSDWVLDEAFSCSL